MEELTRAWDQGDAVLPVDPRLPAPARAAVLEAARLDEPVEPGDALVVATSGTTGAPKLAVLTHDAVAASAAASSAALAVEPEADRWLACLPLAHVGGLSVVTRALLTGTPLTVLDGFDAADVVQAARSGCTLVSLVPTALARVDPGLFRVVLVGGQAPPADRPPNVVATYGMTETGSGIAYDGQPLDGVDLRTGAGSEVQVRGPMLLRCYRDGTDPKDRGGWFRTGDAGEVVDGRLSVHGRLGDVIVTGGEKVWPAAVEPVLEAHPLVAEAALTGAPDAEWGNRVVALVVAVDPSDPPTLEALRELVKEHLPPWCAPKELRLVAELPRTASGKVRRPRISGG